MLVQSSELKLLDYFKPPPLTVQGSILNKLGRVNESEIVLRASGLRAENLLDYLRHKGRCRCPFWTFE